MANKPLTQDQLAKVEEKLKTYMANKQSWVKRYGKDAENVMRGRAISTVKKETENMNKQKLKELIKTSLMKEEADFNLKDSVRKTINTSGYNEKDFQIISEPTNPNSIELRSGGGQYWAQLPEDLLSSLENEFNVVEDFLEDEDTLPLYYYMITPKMNEGKKEDITGPKGKPDGKIDSKDYLAKRDAAIKKAKGVELDEALSSEQKMVETFLKRIAKEFDYSIQDAARFVKDTISKMDLKESPVNEDLDLGHQDNEPHMIKGELYRIGKYAMELYQMVDGFEGKGEVDFPAWWQSKITTSMNNMVSAKHYLDFETKEPAIDAMVGVASDEEVIDENISKEETLAGKIAKALKDKANKDSSDQTNLKQARTALNKGNLDAAKKIADPYLEEKKLTSAEKKKKEEMYAVVTDKAKKVAETIAKKLKEGDSRTLETLEQDIKMIANDKNPKFADQKDSIIVKLEKIYRKKGGKKSLNDIIKK
jgi:hypothetical protein